MNRNAASCLRVTFFGFLLTAAVTLGGVVTASAQDDQSEVKTKPLFGEMRVTPPSIEFKPIKFGKTPDSESKSFSVKDIGTAPLTVSVGAPGTSEFTITQGGGQTILQPKAASLAVTVVFAPGSAGIFKDTIAVSSDATKGKADVSIKLASSAKGTPLTPPPAPTPIPTATAIPTAGNSIFVANSSAIAVLGTGDSVTAYPVSGAGDIAPAVNMSGSSPLLFKPPGIAIDSKGTVYVANETGGTSGNGSVTVYAAGSNGNATPTLTIAGPDTGLSQPVGIALDAAGNIYVANESGPPVIDGEGAGSITVYAAGSNGDAAPTATISNTVFPGMSNPSGIAVDQDSGNIFVASQAGGDPDVVEYAPGSNGEATPIATIAGSNTGLTGEVQGIALNPLNGDIDVVNIFTESILVFPAGSNGNVEPKAAIEGPDTGLDAPFGIALDSSGIVYVANGLGGMDFGSITVYPAGSNGNVTPSATIEGSNTLLSGPYGVAVGP